MVAIMRSLRAPRIASPLTGFAGSVYTTSASRMASRTSSGVGIGGFAGPPPPAPPPRRGAGATAGVGRVGTILKRRGAEAAAGRGDGLRDDHPPRRPPQRQARGG